MLLLDWVLRKNKEKIKIKINLWCLFSNTNLWGSWISYQNNLEWCTRVCLGKKIIKAYTHLSMCVYWSRGSSSTFKLILLMDNIWIVSSNFSENTFSWNINAISSNSLRWEQNIENKWKQSSNRHRSVKTNNCGFGHLSLEDSSFCWDLNIFHMCLCDIITIYSLNFFHSEVYCSTKTQCNCNLALWFF